MELDKNNISLTIAGYYCNGWPNIKISLNNKTLYNGNINDKIVFNFDNLDFNENNTLSIEHYGKRLGEDNVWDTEVDENNTIIRDKYFTISDISINNISLKEIWHHGSFSNDQTINEHVNEIFFNFNVLYTLDFKTPFYNWVIDKKREGYLEIGPTWKKSALNSLSDGYSISLLKIESLFDDIEQEIKKLWKL